MPKEKNIFKIYLFGFFLLPTIFFIFGVFLILWFYSDFFTSDALETKNTPIPVKSESKTPQIDFRDLTIEEINKREDQIFEGWQSSIENINLTLRRTQDFTNQNVLQSVKRVKQIYGEKGLFNQNLRRLAGSSLAKQFWRTYNREFAINHLFSGEGFAELLEGTSHWDVHLALAKLHLAAAEFDPDHSVGAYFQAADLFLDLVLVNPNLSPDQKREYFEKSKNLFSKSSNILAETMEELWQSDPRRAAKIQYYQVKVLSKSDLLNEKFDFGRNWRDLFSQSIEVFENNPVRTSPIRGALARIDFAHLLAEIDGESADSQIKSTLEKVVAPTSEEVAEYISTYLQLESSPEHDLHFHKRGLQILGNTEPRFRDLMLENGFEESFFTDFSLPIYPLPPQN